MAADEYLGQEQFEIAVAPARVAYLITQDSESGFRRAIQEASTRWGGASEPIVPVDETGVLEEGLGGIIDLLDLHELVNVDAEPAIAEKVASALGLPLVSIERIDDEGIGQFTCHPSVVTPLPPPAPQQFGISDQFAIAMNPCIYADEALDLWAMTASGSLSAEHVAIMASAGDPIIGMKDEFQIALAQIGGRTVLDRTTHQMMERFSSNGPLPAPAIIWLTENGSYGDCLNYWNLRALRPMAAFGRIPMAILPADRVDAFQMFGQQIRNMLKGRPDNFAPDVAFVSRTVSQERMREIGLTWGLEETTGDVRSEISIPPPPVRTEPYTFRVDINPIRLFLWKRIYGAVTNRPVQIYRNRTVVEFQSPVEFVSNIGGFLGNFSSPTLGKFPKRDCIARLIAPEGRWRNTGIEKPFQVWPTYSLDVRIPDLRDVVTTIINAATTTSELSDKGRIGESLASAFDISHLSNPGVLKTISELTTRRSARLALEVRSEFARDPSFDVEAFAASIGGRMERRSRCADDIHGVAPEIRVAALESLVAIGWAERGLRIVCKRCGVASFVLLADATDDARCPGCRGTQQYERSAKSPTIFYRLNSLVDRASDQGVLPHLLIAAELVSRSANTYVIPGLNVSFDDGLAGELDIVGVHDGKVIAGEIKTRAAEFTEEQLLHDFSLSRHIGADTHVMGCLEKLTPDSVSTAQNIAINDGLELLLLGGEQLKILGLSDVGAVTATAGRMADLEVRRSSP
jgi:hypothetical protein